MEKLVKNIDLVVGAKVALDMLLLVIGIITGIMNIAVIGLVDLMFGTGIEVLIWFGIGMVYFKTKEKKARK